MTRDCYHEKCIDYDKVLADMRDIFANEAAGRQLFLEEEVSEAKENWVCIDVESAQTD